MVELNGVASLALLPSGSISGHFVHSDSRTCLGIYGTEIACERECSRAEDYRLIDLRIRDYKSAKEAKVVVECRGHDAARFQNANEVHGWEEGVVDAARDTTQHQIEISFACSTLKSDDEAEKHLQKFLPALVNRGAVVNIGVMIIKGLDIQLNKSCEPEASLGPGSTEEELDEPGFVPQDEEPIVPLSVTVIPAGEDDF